MHTPLRFNLIMHGLLGILKPLGRLGWDIYVPVPDECAHGAGMHGSHEPHFALWGTPVFDLSNPLRGLDPIPNENFIIDMHYQHSFREPCEFDANECIVLNGLIPQPPFIWSKISVPLPTVIRKYRAIESTPNPTPDPTTAGALALQPRLVHQVVVFSYLDVHGPIAVIGDGSTAMRDLQPYEASRHALNFGIYYQPKSKIETPHRTIPFDQMFKVRSNGIAVPIQVGSLTSQGPSTSMGVDGPPGVFAKDTGLHPKDLASLYELSTAQSISLENANAGIEGMAAERIVLKMTSDSVILSHTDPTSCGQTSGTEGT